MDAEIRQGDVMEVMKALPDGHARCCITSPPYWGLRDYGTATWEGGDAACDHVKPNQNATTTTMTGGTATLENRHFYKDTCGKCGARRIDAQLGLEPTPEEYVSRLVEVFREVRRVLADDGTLWLNLGDSYTSVGSGGDTKSGFNSRYFGSEKIPDKQGDGRGLVKRSLNHGLKPKDLVGIPWRVAFALQADGWYLRSDIIWSKPNPMPESVTDRPTKAHEYMFLLSKSQRYYYDAEAIREDGEGYGRSNWNAQQFKGGDITRNHGGKGAHGKGGGTPTFEGGRNRRSVWPIATEPFPGAHFAVMPQALVEPCILAGSAPGDTVLDPFAGSGTVGVVSLRHGRRFVGIELSPEYAGMARRRIAGPLFVGGAE